MLFKKRQKKQKKGDIKELAIFFTEVLIIVFILRSLIFQPFNIPSGSMVPTLLIGDYIFVTKYSYGYSKYSFPFGFDIFSGRIFGSKPERGDVVVFRPPHRLDTDFVKRVIGLPGDKIAMKNGRLFINDKVVPRKRIKDLTYLESRGRPITSRQYEETLPNGVAHPILELRGDDFITDNFAPITVPENHFFLMGDNRDNSNDSRAFEVGAIPFENLVGKAQVRFFSIEPPAMAWQIWTWFSGLRPSRIGSLIH